MKVLMFTDPMGSLGKTQEEEYEQLKKDLELVLGASVEAEFNVPPWHLKNRSISLYIFDFGGMGIGCSDTVEGMLRELHKAAIEHPDTLFVIWSSFSWDRYKDLMEYELGDAAKLPNVVCFDGWNREVILDWFGIIPETKPKLIVPKVDDGMPE
jgi:hypothetical protein